MSEANKPEVGSTWIVGGARVSVAELRKRGRGWQVIVEPTTTYGKEGAHTAIKFRLRDFNKIANQV